MLLLSSGLTPSFRSRLLLSLRSVIGVRFTVVPAPDFVAFIGCCCWLLVLIVFNCVGVVYYCICFYCLVVCCSCFVHMFVVLFCAHLFSFVVWLLSCTSFLCRSLLCCVAHTFISPCFISSIMCIVVCLFPLCCQSCAHTSFHHIVLAIMCSIGCGDWIVFVHHHYC